MTESTSEKRPARPTLADRDRLVARGFWRSIGVFAVIGAVLLGWRLLSRPVETRQEGEQAPVAPPVEVVREAPEATAIPCTDVARDAGVASVHDSGARGRKLLPECLAGGVAVADLDGDGRLDLVLSNGCPLEPVEAGERSAPTGGLLVHRNITEPGGPIAFDAARPLAEGAFVNGVAVGDVDGDGRPDLYAACVGQDRLFLGVAGGTGELAFREGALPAESAWGTSAGMLDADDDGDLDVVVANYVVWSPEIDRAVGYTLDGIGRAYGPPTGFEGSAVTLLVNDGGTLRDATEAAGIDVRHPVTGARAAKALGLLFADVDRDGRPDILVANDTTPKFLLLNQGPREDGSPAFVDAAIPTGFAYDRDGKATGAMGIDATFLAAGEEGEELAIAVGNFAAEPCSLYVGRNGRSLADEALGRGIGAPTRRSLTFGAVFADLDLDGDDDVAFANGHLEPDIERFQKGQRYEQPAQVLVDAGPGARPRFVEVPAARLGDLGLPAVGRALAAGDLDRDGDVDLVLVSLDRAPRILRNDQETGHRWLAVEPRGRGSVGAEVEIEWAGEDGRARVARRIVSPTRSYLSQCEPVARFGLGGATRAEVVRVRFADGATVERREVAGDQLLVIEHPEGTPGVG
jgi:hypothetical protein